MLEWTVFLGVVALGVIAWRLLFKPRKVRYRKKSLLTGLERELFSRLCDALPECHVCPKVAVAALVEPAGVGKLRKVAGDAIFGRRVGFAILDDEFQLLCVAELAHRSGASRDEAARKAGLASAGIRTLRFSAKRMPSAAKIRTAVFARAAHAAAAMHGAPDRRPDLEFRKTPWRNTANAHL